MKKQFTVICSILFFMSCGSFGSSGNSIVPLPPNSVFQYGQLDTNVLVATNENLTVLGINRDGLSFITILAGKVENFNDFKGQYVFSAGDKATQFVFTKKSEFLTEKGMKNSVKMILGFHYLWQKEYQEKNGLLYPIDPFYVVLKTSRKESLIHRFEVPKNMQTNGDNSVYVSVAGALVERDIVLCIINPVMKINNYKDRENNLSLTLNSLQFQKERINLESLRNYILANKL
ncbi:putative lipoprotein [Leptospira fainei serovar Hurstbridge str. BUT 6]|uniref:Lipoprotein n=1 Tax=Leptospira fainei serovar Hurstbridge str. BUT 6 TaxID=1193011 RepID=S3VEP7_9LEPT|nr:hypothetical protein [Leptospira fainei]EPG74960.1 putative lipoprotein [Leptospira fainei serovar Hurstbridge str. BUT 6]